MLPVCVVALLAMMAAGVVFFLPTRHGIIRIEITDPEIEVVFNKNGTTIKGKRTKDIRVEPGEHLLEITRGDFRFKTNRFVLERGKTMIVKVELIQGALRVTRDGKVIDDRLLPRKHAAKEPIPPKAPSQRAKASS